MTGRARAGESCCTARPAKADHDRMEGLPDDLQPDLHLSRTIAAHPAHDAHRPRLLRIAPQGQRTPRLDLAAHARHAHDREATRALVEDHPLLQPAPDRAPPRRTEIPHRLQPDPDLRRHTGAGAAAARAPAPPSSGCADDAAGPRSRAAKGRAGKPPPRRSAARPRPVCRQARPRSCRAVTHSTHSPSFCAIGRGLKLHTSPPRTEPEGAGRRATACGAKVGAEVDPPRRRRSLSPAPLARTSGTEHARIEEIVQPGDLAARQPLGLGDRDREQPQVGTAQGIIGSPPKSIRGVTANSMRQPPGPGGRRRRGQSH